MSKKEAKYLYGLDLAWTTGIAIYDIENHEVVYVGNINAEKIKIKKKEKDSGYLEHSMRLNFIYQNLKELSKKYPPSVIAIERYFGRFNNATIALSKVHGLVNYMFHGIPQWYYPPKTVKEAVIKGDASKEMVQKVIKIQFAKKGVNLEFADENESDAMGVAVTYLIKNKMIDWKIDLSELNKVKPKAKKKKKSTETKTTTKKTVAKKKK